MARPKIALIGGGNIGGVLAEQAAYRELGDVVIFDVVEGMPQAKGMDFSQAAPLRRYGVRVVGSNDFSALEESDVVVITAGIPRKAV